MASFKGLRGLIGKEVFLGGTRVLLTDVGPGGICFQLIYDKDRPPMHNDPVERMKDTWSMDCDRYGKAVGDKKYSVRMVRLSRLTAFKTWKDIRGISECGDSLLSRFPELPDDNWSLNE